MSDACSENSQDLTLIQTYNALAVSSSWFQSKPEKAEEKMPWGRVVPKKNITKRSGHGEARPQENLSTIFDICDESFSIGRGPDADWVLSNEFIHATIFDRISKIHCRITKDCSEYENPVYIEDLSRNGTFVNGQLIGFNKKRILKTNDVISFNEPMYTFFQFINCYREGLCGLPDVIIEKYYVGKHLGAGGQGSVRLVIDRITCKKFAMKTVKKKLYGNLSDEKIMREVVIMNRLTHSNIIRCHDAIIREKCVYMFLDYMEGGDLLRHVYLKTKLSVENAKYFFRQACAAVKHFHDQNIIHRDIKPDNILLSSNNELAILKVSDFGLSKLFSQDNSELHTICGSPLFVAPEISLKVGRPTGTYTNKIDIWGLGIVLHTMFCPFLEKTNFRSGKLNFEHEGFRDVPESTIDLIKKLLANNPNDRPSIDEVLMHPWVNDGSQNMEELNAMFQVKIKEPPMKRQRVETSEMNESILNEKCCIM